MKDEFDEVKQTTEEQTEPKEWKFDGVAHTQGEILIENDEFEIIIPANEPASQPVEMPMNETADEAPKAPKKKLDPKKVKKALISVAIAVCVVAVTVFGVFFFTVPNSDERMNPGNVALTVNKTDVSIGMYNYYYTCITQRYIQYAQYGYYQDLDPSVDFNEQKTVDADGNEITWADMFVKDTIDQLKYITSFYEAAVDAGLELTDAQKETINSQLDSLKESASQADKSVDEYIKETYGDYCGLATLNKMLEQCLLAEQYYQQYNVTNTVTDEEVQKYFEENKNDVLSVPFAYLQVIFDGEETTQAEAEEKANNYASQIKTVTDMKTALPKACEEIIAQYVGMGYFDNATEAATALAQEIETSIKKSDDTFSDEANEWLFADSTKIGDCKTFTDADNGVVYIVLKTGNADVQRDKIYSVRHILVMPKDDEGNALEDPTKGTDAQFEKAKNDAEAILAEFNKGDKSEISFAKLAEEKSEDVESTSNGSSGIYGGLCGGVSVGEMVKPFEDWSINSARKYGDVDIVKSQYGYHIMFFVENSERYLYDCKQAVRSQKEEDFVKNAKCKQHKMVLKKAKVQEPIASDSGDPTDDDSDNMDY